MKLNIFLFSLLVFFSSCDYIAPSAEKDSPKKTFNGVKKNYLNGKLASTVTYKDSLKNGPAVNYYPDGKVNMEFNYKDNKKNGSYKWYFENGKTYLEGEYLDGKKEGVFKTYRNNGTLKAEMPWHQDNPCVGLKEYFESGNIKAVPKIEIKHKNTIKLNNKYEVEINLSDNSKNVEFYEGYLDDSESFSNYFPELPSKKGKATLTYFILSGELIMKTVTIIAKIKTDDKNYYILKKNVNISAENRPQ